MISSPGVYSVLVSAFTGVPMTDTLVTPSQGKMDIVNSEWVYSVSLHREDILVLMFLAPRHAFQDT
jgi:hypothetical protein